VASALVRDKPSPAGNADLKTFVQALQQLTRSAPTVLALPNRTLAQSTAISAKDSQRLSDYVAAIVALLGPKPKAAPSRRDTAIAHMKLLISQGELIPSARFVESLGLTRQALSKAVSAQRLFYIEMGGERYYPAFFLEATLDRHQLEQISKALGELPGASKLQFFRGKKASLDGLTPLDALAKGKFSLVRDVAIGFTER
jgi:hypothetical protein